MANLNKNRAAAEALQRAAAAAAAESDLLACTVETLCRDNPEGECFIDEGAGFAIIVLPLKKPKLSGKSLIVGQLNGQTSARFGGRPVRVGCNLFAKASEADKNACIAAGRVKVKDSPVESDSSTEHYEPLDL